MSRRLRREWKRHSDAHWSFGPTANIERWQLYGGEDVYVASVRRGLAVTKVRRFASLDDAKAWIEAGMPAYALAT